MTVDLVKLFVSIPFDQQRLSLAARGIRVKEGVISTEYSRMKSPYFRIHGAVLNLSGSGRPVLPGRDLAWVENHKAGVTRREWYHGWYKAYKVLICEYVATWSKETPTGPIRLDNFVVADNPSSFRSACYTMAAPPSPAAGVVNKGMREIVLSTGLLAMYGTICHFLNWALLEGLLETCYLSPVPLRKHTATCLKGLDVVMSRIGCTIYSAVER
ncbi:hypothetical protein MGYG_02922 [Nannizzia gypsea CBS 118893]|uniref:Uncharacterized protein n=1 Tax=Arthroderma gypseum (strain ATCC MYA-4604 / CBS 118893) TaxID=535722 RepID=E4UPU2_ARTGP|nr:hypothetical protein MGYG_02922 [Nannizzia gypsea CBS 118893]EFQ99914.1 hypothetical protein MGYG_02922 [Nannizzia gypsea CBS 118893]